MHKIIIVINNPTGALVGAWTKLPRKCITEEERDILLYATRI
jgi:hypothetical protein